MQIIIGGILLLVIGGLLIGVIRRNFFPLLILSGMVWAAFAYTAYFFWTLGIGFVLLLAIAYIVQMRNLKNIRSECEPLLRQKNLVLVTEKFVGYDHEQKKLFLKEYWKKLSTYAIDGDDFLHSLLAWDVISFSKTKINNIGDAAIFEKKDGEEYLKKSWGFMKEWDMDMAIKVLKKLGVRATEQAIVDQREKKPVVLINIRLTDEDNDSDPLISCGNVIDLD